MSALVLSIADRQPQDVQRRAIRAVALQRERDSKRPCLAEIMGWGREPSATCHASLDTWYRAQPIPKGKISPVLRLSREEKVIYGLPASAQLVELRGLGHETDHARIVLIPVMRGWVVGVKARLGGGGVGVLWRKSYKAAEYARRLQADHGLALYEVWA